jgi:branched-chain amino acid transport system permease protein
MGCLAICSPRLRDDMRGIIAIAVVLLVAPLTGSAFAVTIANTIMLQAMPALGLALLMGYAGQISLGHPALYGLGAYGTAILSVKYGVNPWLSLVCAIGFVALICDGLGRLIFRLHGHHLAIATLGLLIIVYVGFVELKPWTGGPNGLTGIKPLTIWGFAFDSDARFFVLAFIAFIGVLLCSVNLVRSPIGLVMRAIADSERGAASLGANVAALKRRILVLSGIFSALGGGLYAHYIGFVSPQPFGVAFTIKLLLMVAIGGFRNIAGVVFGVAFVTTITEPLQELGYFDVVVFGVLLVTSMLLAPDGLPAGLAQLWGRMRARPAT